MIFKSLLLGFVVFMLLITSVNARYHNSGGDNIENGVTNIDSNNSGSDNDEMMIEEETRVRSLDGTETREKLRVRLDDGKLKERFEKKLKTREANLKEKLEKIRLSNVSDIEIDDLKCHDSENIRDRIKCRIEIKVNKTGKAQMREEFKLQYLPEDCRVIEDKEKRNECVRKYASVQKCWKLERVERDACIKEQLNLPEKKETLRGDVKECKDLKGEERGICLRNIKDKVHHLIKFRIHKLGEKAARLRDEGRVDEEAYVDFVTHLEIKKTEFAEATTKEERRKIILDVKELWKSFIANVSEDDGNEQNETGENENEG